MSVKLSRLRYPEALFLAILTIRLSPSPTALVISVGKCGDVIEVLFHRTNELP